MIYTFIIEFCCCCFIGEHVVTYSLNWDRTEITIPVGDSVTWCLGQVDIGQGTLMFNIDEIEPNQTIAGSVVYTIDGFSDSSSSCIQVIFSNIATHYFAISDSITADMTIGIVSVTMPASTQRKMEVYVGGFLVPYMDMSGSNLSDLEICYSSSSTPTVLHVYPNNGTVKTVFTITGNQLGGGIGSNVITFGDYACIAQNSSENMVYCIMEPSAKPPPNIPLPISFTNTESGFGLAFVQNPDASTVTFLPLVMQVSPSEGSLAGGTGITISGETFELFEGSLRVMLGTYLCSIMSVQYSNIECITSLSTVEEESNIRFYIDEEEIAYICDGDNDYGCTFTYSRNFTPIVQQVYPDSLSGPGNHTIELFGQGFCNTQEDQYNVTLNDIACSVISSNCTNIFCDVSSLPAGNYKLGLSIYSMTENGFKSFGNGLFESDTQIVSVIAKVYGVSPQNGSTNGGTHITIHGSSLSGNPSSTSVDIGGSECRVISAVIDEINCITTSHSSGKFPITVMDNDLSVNDGVDYEFSSDLTPTVSSITPSQGSNGDFLILDGTMFGDSNSVSVEIGGEPCEVQPGATDTSLTCQLGPNFAGALPVAVTNMDLGSAEVSAADFNYMFIITSLSDTSGSMAGQNVLEIEGAGFDPSVTTVTICDIPCLPTSTVPSMTITECIVPPMVDTCLMTPATPEIQCSVVVESLNEKVVYNEMYVYRCSLTPHVISINDTRGGTEGGTGILIQGSGFTGTASVSIAGSICDIVEQSETHITCSTSRSGRTIRAKVMVWIEEKGFAVSHVYFWYVDLWSSPFTWGGGPLPQEGDFVVIPKGQTLVLDTTTPILGYLLIQGGELIFDREKGDDEVQLHTQGGIILGGGVLEVGTEDDPFLSKTQIVLYGHVLSTEIPVYGAKTLALREGRMDMHGKPLNVTWTRLAETAEAGALEIHLEDTVDWEVGGHIVIASTSFSQSENEEMEIAAVSAGAKGSILTLTYPIIYEHISVQEMIAGRIVETRGEVGYLTRNILVRGNRNGEWDRETITCPEEFRPGQFEVQSCFEGRFGSEIVGDQFGSQLMVHAAELNKGDVIGRFEHIETSHAGQAFRLGRYPIHFHLNGDVSGSYVRGCSIHHTFNRAVTIHGVDNLLVEKNVAYDVLGHAYFLEDGIEQHNTIQDNLGVFVRSSSSLLNVDITPATFWIVNANNIVRRNAAAGGTHFGFWYRLPKNPTGPSFTTSICPRKQPVLEFNGNTAHSFGWYGLWVFRQYRPSPSGKCNDNEHAPSFFDNFTSWHNDRGVEFAEVGSVHLRDSIMVNNRLAGVEVIEIESDWNTTSTINNTLIVGYSSISSGEFCTEAGIKTPKSYYLTVCDVTFANFDRDNCSPIAACAHCKNRQGGFETRYQNISFNNPGEYLTKWQWEMEHIHRDLDGTLTGSDSPKILIPTNGMLDLSRCSDHSGAEGPIRGSICDGDLEFGRFALFDPTPQSLEFSSLNISNDNGNSILPFIFKRLRNTGPAYMAQLEENKTYTLAWRDGETFTNISYSTLISGIMDYNYISIRYKYPISLDIIDIAGVTSAKNASLLNLPSLAMTGDYYIEDDNVTLVYILKGGDFHENEQRNEFQTITCFHPNCIAPPLPTLPPPIPPGRPDDVLMWSNASIWPDNIVPTAGQDVIINESIYVIIDVPTPKLGMLTIHGGLEFLDSEDRVLEANVIIIDSGRLVAGYPDTPYRHNLRIILHGNVASPQYMHGPERINVGSKAIGVFGELILNSKMDNPKSWTTLANTAHKGSNQITLTDNVDWSVGDTIVITSTSFDAFETEEKQIVAMDQQVLMLGNNLLYDHFAIDEIEGSVSYSMRAEVGCLTRKIVIENGEPDTADVEAFGCRVLVSSSGLARGTVQLTGVEFKGCGQIGLTDDYDPHFALALVNTGRHTDSYVNECSFHNGYNTGIGVYGTDNMLFVNNVIHSTVGPSMIITGSDHRVIKNLASLSQFIGTYRDRDEPLNSLWTANFMIVDTNRIIFTYNHAAGGAKAGIHMDGEDCESSSSENRHNVAHSSLHCFHIGYEDGSSTGCTRVDNITAYSCHHYGLFSYSEPEIQIFNSTFINNKAAIFTAVFGPPSLLHMVGTKSVQIEHTTIVSASSSFNCIQDGIHPVIANHIRSHSPGIRTPTHGHVGIISNFVSGKGSYPKFPWPSNHNYPAIGGVTRLTKVAFVGFGNRCGNQKDSAIMTSPHSEDANHPTHLEMITFENCDNNSKLFVHEPALNRVNPSDCVDMDCDGMKSVLFRDIDGSFTETGEFSTMVSMAEFEWDGDRRRGLGDYRIPKTMISDANGMPIDVDTLYPAKGIVRGQSYDMSECDFNVHWNMYVCQNLDHLLLVMESLDEDTEVRRLSPIGIGTNGFINLLNGPMDNGWCGGYTCQERISTFYGIVAADFTYVIGLTSTNPQQFALHLLNSEDNQGIIVRIIYTNPQRLDVYFVNDNGEDKYVVPKNAELLEDGNLKYTSDLPDTSYYPVIDDKKGANYYDRSLKRLHINIKGNRAYKIITTPVIMLSITVSVSAEDFFDEELVVRNIALLLSIPPNKIRIVNVVKETSQKRKRRQVGGNDGNTSSIDIEIGNAPNTTGNDTSGMGTNTTDTNSTNTFNFEELADLTEMVAEVVQTGQILMGSNGTSLIAADIEQPIAAPVDPTDGVRATPETGGIQPDDVGENETVLTFYEEQLMEEVSAANDSAPVVLSIPSILVVSRQLTGTVIEGFPITQEVAPVFTMLDNNGQVSTNLGLGIPWKLTAIITSGPLGSFLTNHTLTFEEGHASAEGAVFSHPGTYSLTFTVSFPESANFSITLDPIVVEKRYLSLEVFQQPRDGNTTFALYPYPVVRLVDETLQSDYLLEHSWRNTTWYIIANLMDTELEWRTELEKGEAVFRDIIIPDPSIYLIVFSAFTEPELSSDLLPESVASQSFKITTLQFFTRFIITYFADYGAVINDSDAEFINAFVNQLSMQYPEAETFNTTTSEGSIIVSTFITAQTTTQLVDIINHILLNGNDTLAFEFGGQTLVPSSVVQDPAYLIYLEEDNMVVILATTIPATIILLCVCLMILVVGIILNRRRTKKDKSSLYIRVSMEMIIIISVFTLATDYWENKLFYTLCCQ